MSAYKFNLDSVANQSFTTTLNNHVLQIDLITARDILTATVYMDDELVVAGCKCIPDETILPGSAELAIGGRMYFSTLNDEYPSYEKLGTDDCVLMFEEK